MLPLFIILFVIGLVVSILGTVFNNVNGNEIVAIICAVIGFSALVVGAVGIGIIIII